MLPGRDPRHHDAELRTPLNAINGFSEMIAHEEAMLIDAARRREYARSSSTIPASILSVVNGILDMSKMETAISKCLAGVALDARAALPHCCTCWR
jgi:cell cycle sensor histidine kinase DivJ